jgi:hypothetical protein
MADEPQVTKITKDDVEGMAAKLEAFAETLPEQEQNVLGWIITRAQAAPEGDTEGYSNLSAQQLAPFQTPLSAQLGRAAGFGPRAGGTTTVTWAYKFGRELNPGQRFQTGLR